MSLAVALWSPLHPDSPTPATCVHHYDTACTQEDCGAPTLQDTGLAERLSAACTLAGACAEDHPPNPAQKQAGTSSKAIAAQGKSARLEQ